MKNSGETWVLACILTLWLLPVSPVSLQGQADWDSYLEPSAIEWSEEEPGEWVDDLKGHRFVLLGESTHGTSEFYLSRSLVSRQLMEERSHRFVVVEGDWDGMRLADRYVRGDSEFTSAQEVLHQLNCWPKWMWANEEFAELLEWMRRQNEQRSGDQRLAVYGMDIYSWPATYDRLRDWVQENEPGFLSAFERRMRPLVRYREDPSRYSHAAWALATQGPETVPRALKALRDKIESAELSEREQTYLFLEVESVAAAERHLRQARLDNAKSWNARARHMKNTVVELAQLLPPEQGILVWAHNTHIGDARATPMGAQGMVNIAHLMRERKDSGEVVLIGQTTGEGDFLAARQWAGAREVFSHPDPIEGSLEAYLAEKFQEPVMVPFSLSAREAPALPVIGHRAIGVVYQEQAPQQQYVPSNVPQRYDALVFFPQTRALAPLHEKE